VFVLLKRIQRARTKEALDIAKNNFIAMKEDRTAGEFVTYVEETFLTTDWIEAFCDIRRQAGNSGLWNTNNGSEATIRTIQRHAQ
jgi:hypothetical protein